MILNKSKNVALAADRKMCTGFFSKLRGLMFSKKIEDIGYIFEFDRAARRSLHMLFVFFPIDVIFLDKDKKVVELKQHFRPFSLYNPKHEAKYVIELPDKTITESGTEIGDKIMF